MTLRQEVERLRSDLEDVTQALKNEIAENERLRAALTEVKQVSQIFASSYRVAHEALEKEVAV